MTRQEEAAAALRSHVASGSRAVKFVGMSGGFDGPTGRIVRVYKNTVTVVLEGEKAATPFDVSAVRPI